MAVTDFSTKTHSPSRHPWTVYTGNKTCFCLFWTCDVTYGNNYIQLMTWDPLWLPGGLCSVQCISPSYSLETCCQVPLLNMRCTSLWWQVLFFSQYNHTSLLCSLSSALGAFCFSVSGVEQITWQNLSTHSIPRPACLHPGFTQPMVLSLVEKKRVC